LRVGALGHDKNGIAQWRPAAESFAATHCAGIMTRGKARMSLIATLRGCQHDKDFGSSYTVS